MQKTYQQNTRCAYIDTYGVCLEPDGCEMQHTDMSTSSSAFTPTPLSTKSAEFDPSKLYPSESYISPLET